MCIGNKSITIIAVTCVEFESNCGISRFSIAVSHVAHCGGISVKETSHQVHGLAGLLHYIPEYVEHALQWPWDYSFWLFLADATGSCCCLLLDKLYPLPCTARQVRVAGSCPTGTAGTTGATRLGFGRSWTTSHWTSSSRVTLGKWLVIWCRESIRPTLAGDGLCLLLELLLLLLEPEEMELFELLSFSGFFSSFTTGVLAAGFAPGTLFLNIRNQNTQKMTISYLVHLTQFHISLGSLASWFDT